MRYIIGLGNPGEEYELTRHNAGRMAVLDFIKKQDLEEPEFDKKLKALAVKGEVGKEKIQIILPETFMNKSGDSLKKLITSAKSAKNLIVVHDDIDLPLGKIKISFGKSSGGHKGVESVIKAVKTKDFIRIRIGISAATPAGKIKKPSGEQFLNYIIGKFKPAELAVFKKVLKNISSALETIIKEGREKAMSEFN